jgi:quinoprotein relay system zinc metallohydrolase 2
MLRRNSHLLRRETKITRLARGIIGVLALMASHARAEPLTVAEIAPGVFVHSGPHEDLLHPNPGDIANIGFVVGADAVAVIDTGGSRQVGKALMQAVRARTALPIRYVILTHVHPDHIFGAAAFLEEKPQVIGHARLPAALAARGGHYRRNMERDLGLSAADLTVITPDRTVTATMEIDLGGRRLVLRAHPTAHTDNDLSVFDTATATLWTGDLLFRERVPVIDGSAKGWLKVMDELAAIKAARVVPGHGPVATDWPAALDPQRRYVTLVHDGVRAHIRARKNLDQAVKSVASEESGSWLLFDRYHARNVTAAFVEAEWD